MQDTRSWVQQVSELLVVDLEETSLNVELFLSLGDLFEEIAHREEEEAVCITCRGL